jgi:hypothetical protein
MRKEGIANWTAEARAKSLATRRARGSVWGWDKRARALESVSSEALTKSLESLEEFDASETGIRARSTDDEMSFVDEEEYQELLAAEKRQQDSDRALEMGMMMAVGAPGITKVTKTANLTSKSVSAMSDVVNSQRAVITAYDLSAPFRQGGILSIAHPARIVNAYVNMLRAAKSAKAAAAVMNGIKSRKYYELYEDSGLYLAEADKGAEEVFKSIFAKKIPGVNMSERAYNAYLNTLRADSFDSLVDALKAASNKAATKAGYKAYEEYAGKLSAESFSSMDDALASVKGAQKKIADEIIKNSIQQKELEAIANFVNVATGRGNIGAAEKYAEELSTIFFAPKLTASRVQFLVGQPLYSGSLRTRLILSGEYGKYLAGLGTLYGLAVLSGAKVSWDTRSNDFGVIRYGQNRINPLSGLGKHAIFAGRLISGQFVGASGKAESIYDDKGRNNWDDVTGRYIRSTLAPLYGTAYTLAKGRGIDGKPYNVSDVPYDLVPLSARDIYEQYRDNSFGTATAMSLISLHGGGIDTYVKKEPRMTKAQVIKAIENGEAFDAASLYK